MHLVVVMPGLVPGIHVLWLKKEDVDGRDKPGHDGIIGICTASIFILHCGKKIATQGWPGSFWSSHHVTPDHAFRP